MTWIGLVAAILTTVSFLPQTIKTIITRKTEGISLIMYFLFTVGVLLWTFYGLYLNDLAITLANSLTCVLASVILIIKFNNVKKHGENI